MVFAFLPFRSDAISRDPVIDSLLSKLKSTRDSDNVDVLISLSYRHIWKDTVKSDYYRNYAYQKAKALKYVKGLGWCHYLRGTRKIQQNKYITAINEEARAISIGQEVNDYDLIARSQNTIGLANLLLEDEYNALKSFQGALKALERAHDKSFEGAFVGNMGIAYIKSKNFHKGLKYLKQAGLMHQRSGNKIWLSDNYLETGYAYEHLQDYNQARIYGLRSLALANESDISNLKVRAMILLGSVYIKLNNLHTAKVYLDNANKLVDNPNLTTERYKLYKHYSALFEKRKNFPVALFYEKKAALLHDTLFNSDRDKIILEYQEKYQAQQRELENQHLRNEQGKKDIQLKKNNQRINQIYTLLAAFCLILLLIFWINRRVRQKNRLLILKSNEIQHQKEQVEQINQIKDKLFSVIAHDLRSPFASMKSMMDMYEDGMMSKEEVGYFFKEVSKDIGTNNLLLDNLLAWAKSQLHGFVINPKPVAIAQLADEVLIYYAKQLVSKNLKITNQLNCNCVVFADYEMTKTVLRNLVGNAIKFTPKSGNITLSCANYSDGMLIITVSDTGIGIPPQHIDKLFSDSFFTTQGLNKEKGTGLGLQICKDFVEKSKGSIWAESKPEQGSTFSFTLPRSNEKVTEALNQMQPEDEKLALRQTIRNSTNFQKRYDRYELLSKATNEVIWDSDLIGGEISWNESLFNTFGHPFEKTTDQWWNDMIHPDDLKAVKTSIKAALRKKQSTWEHEYRFRCADNSYKYVANRGVFLYDDQGKALRMIGVIRDIHVQKQAIRELQRLSLVAKNVNNLVVITDYQNQVVWVNKAFEKYTGYSLPEIIGKRPRSFLSGEHTDVSIFETTDKYVADRQAFSTEIIHYTKSGKPFWVQLDATPYDDPVTMQTGYVAIQTVINERKKSEQIILKKNKTLREIARISSHEVRRPLSSILGLTALLQDQFTPAELEEYIHMLNSSGQQLDVLIRRIHQYIAEIEAEEV